MKIRPSILAVLVLLPSTELFASDTIDYSSGFDCLHAVDESGAVPAGETRFSPSGIGMFQAKRAGKDGIYILTNKMAYFYPVSGKAAKDTFGRMYYAITLKIHSASDKVVSFSYYPNEKLDSRFSFNEKTEKPETPSEVLDNSTRDQLAAQLEGALAKSDRYWSTVYSRQASQTDDPKMAEFGKANGRGIVNALDSCLKAKVDFKTKDAGAKTPTFREAIVTLRNKIAKELGLNPVASGEGKKESTASGAGP